MLKALPGIGAPAPSSPLHAYAPGALARLTPQQRGRALKRSKRVSPGPVLTVPNTILG